MASGEALLRRALDERTLQPVVDDYLKVYIGDDIDWKAALVDLQKALKKRFGSGQTFVEHFRKSLAFTILAPGQMGIPLTSPKGILLTCHDEVRWPDYSKKDWVKLMFKVVEQDLLISQNRKKLLALGIIDPFEYSPWCREAYNKMFEQAETNGVVSTPELKERMQEQFKLMVWAYGGATICGLFNKHPDKIRKVHNWKTAYFVEHALYEVYSFTQLSNTKKTEMDKTNKRLVKRI